MDLGLLTRDAVLAAMAEFRTRGRDDFLQCYGFGPAREYFVDEAGGPYDLKAVVGVAYGYLPGQHVLTPSELSSGDQSVGRVLTRLGFRVRRDRQGSNLSLNDDAWDIGLGDKIKRTELHRRFGGSGQDGVTRSRSTTNVFLFSDPASGEQHGYSDRWAEDGCFYYTGRGQRGDQTFTSGNQAILDHVEEGTHLRLFTGARGTVTYAGEFELDDDQPWVTRRAPETANGPMRDVIVFRLRHVAASAKETSPGDSAATPVGRAFTERHEDIELAARRMPSSLDPDSTGRGLLAHRRLENQVAAVVRQAGYEPMDPLPHDPSFDLVWREGESRLTVCEVKSLTRANQSGQLRLGIGQVLDYRYRLESMSGAEVEAVLAVEEQPTDAEHWIKLCGHVGIRLIWPETLATLWATYD